MNRPEAVVNLLEADGVLLQRIGNEEQLFLEPERPGIRDALHDEVPGILDGRQRTGVGPGGPPIARRGRGAFEELVRSLMVVLGPEAVERALLGRERRSGRPNRFRLERLMHPFVRAVLLRRRGSGALMLNAELQPPDIELRQAVNPRRRERDAIVRANGVRQAVLAEQPVEDRAHAKSPGREQAVTCEEVSRVLVGHGERIAVHAIAGAKVALEVRGPEIIGVRGLDRHDAGMLIVTTATAFLDQALARQEVPRRADGREIDSRVARTQPVQELVRPPARMAPTGLTNQRRHHVGYFVRTPVRRPAAIAETLPPALLKSGPPFVC